jgi:hypothetical protein
MQWRSEKTKDKDRSSRFRAQKKKKLHPSILFLYMFCMFHVSVVLLTIGNE